MAKKITAKARRKQRAQERQNIATLVRSYQKGEQPVSGLEIGLSVEIEQEQDE